MNIYFVFIGEGSADDGFVPHLEKLCIHCGADEAYGIAIDWMRLGVRPSKKVKDKVRAALELEPGANLIFIHRDADKPDPEPRYDEIRTALEELRTEVPGVGVVPVQETEAWLLLDEEEIRRVAENPKGKVRLNLPPASRVEHVADPKNRLHQALLKACELKGQRRKKFKNTLTQRCKVLLERLEPDGNIKQVKAWQRLRSDLEAAIRLAG
jgi:hypothetical protein